MALSKKQKWLGLGLFLSLGLNMFLGGMILGCESGRHHKPPHHAWQKKDEMLKKTLSEADRAVLKDIMQRHASHLASLRRDLKTLRDDITVAGKRDGFDADVLQQKMTAENQKRFEILSLMHDMREEVYADVSDEGRAVLEKIGMKPDHKKNKKRHERGYDMPTDSDYLPFIWEEGQF